MDPNPAQPIVDDVVPQPVSPVRKFLPFILIGVVLLAVALGTLMLFSPSSADKKTQVAPAPRPTATPFPPPTLPMATKAVATTAATTAPEKIGRLAFIKNGDIYNSDFTSFSLLVKNATPAADKLAWSPQGNLLSWRPVSQTATPSAVTVYDRYKKASFSIKPSDSPVAELIDYVWSADEKQIAVLYHDQSYHVGLFGVSTASAQFIPLLARSISIKQILWPNSKTLIFSGDDGINSLDLNSPTPKILADTKQIQKMKLAPSKNKILYSVGTDTKSDLYIVNIDGSSTQLIPPIPSKIDMGETGLPAGVLNNGFLSYALWFPKGDKLMVGYHYLTNLPLVGIYDLKNSSFTALSTFALYENDFMVDDLRMSGTRINTSGQLPTWQVSFFTIEDNAKLATVRVIPEATSPSFFGDDLLPSGNTF